MRYSIVISLAAMAAMSAPASAQQSAPANPAMSAPAPQAAPQLTYEQQVMLNGWPATYRARYAAWSAVAQSYYWTLEPEQQNLFWRFSDLDKERLALMTPDQKLASWNAVYRAVAAQQAAAQQSSPMVQEVPESSETPMP